MDRPECAAQKSEGVNSVGQVGVVIVQYGDSDMSTLVEHLLCEQGVAAVVIAKNPRMGIDPTQSPDPVGAEIINLPTNSGYAAAANAGRAHPALLRLPLHLILTHDVQLELGAVDALIDPLNADARVAIAGPVLRDYQQMSAVVGARRSWWGRVHHHRVPIDRALPSDAQVVTWIDGAVMMLRAAVVPPFDTRYFLYVEDVALCLAVQPEFSVVVATQSFASQRSGMSERPGAHGYLLTRNHILMARFRAERGARVLGAVRSAVGAAGQVVRAIRSNRRQHAKQLVGILWGAVDGIRGKTGAPPERLQKWGDISAALSHHRD